LFDALASLLQYGRQLAMSTVNEPTAQCQSFLGIFNKLQPDTFDGPLLLGYLFNYAFFGALVVQLCIYVEKYPNDSRTVKSLVCVVFLLECVTTVFATYAAWRGTVYCGHMSSVVNSWSFRSLPGLCGISVHSFCQYSFPQTHSTIQPLFSSRISFAGEFTSWENRGFCPSPFPCFL